VNVKKMLVMALVLGLSVGFMAGCGKKEEPAGALDSLTKKAGAVAEDAKAGADKAAADAKVAADKAAADAKAAADKALPK
jgi:hypothetical protein